MEDIDGSKRLITRSFEFNTHLACSSTPDQRRFFPAPLAQRSHLPHRSASRPHCAWAAGAAAESDRTGSSFAADMYFFPSVTGEVLTNAAWGLIGGPVSVRPCPATRRRFGLDELMDFWPPTERTTSFDTPSPPIRSICAARTPCSGLPNSPNAVGDAFTFTSVNRKEWPTATPKPGSTPWNTSTASGSQPGTVCSRLMGEEERDSDAQEARGDGRSCPPPT